MGIISLIFEKKKVINHPYLGAFIRRPGTQVYPLAPKPEIKENNLKLIADKLIALK
ncbi:hypothetical protein M4I21_13990 [Cellulophaga sp. 20_2_10]|uniref:hypothetical protein n=1 Tax=Cellulophaga sp. 20_2_10 TaxID=2942476 RepID=UPI00201A8CF0|nr:hypothetical protein [Cellulophaga sp. 20_2_10]MCL5246929.1 hypothetical protein [Cellulophaga sp. 20_2_10]